MTLNFILQAMRGMQRSKQDFEQELPRGIFSLF